MYDDGAENETTHHQGQDEHHRVRREQYDRRGLPPRRWVCAEEDEPQSIGVRAHERSKEHDLGHERGNIEPARGRAHKRLSSKTSSVSQSVVIGRPGCGCGRRRRTHRGSVQGGRPIRHGRWSRQKSERGQGPKGSAGTAARGDIWPWDGICSDEARAKRYDASHAVGDALVLPHIETSAIQSWRVRALSSCRMTPGFDCTPTMGH